MIDVVGDIWTVQGDAICVPTNGVIDSRGNLVMGAGMALQAKRYYPDLPRQAGRLVDLYGNIPYLFEMVGKDKTKRMIVTFPTKRDYKENASIRLIENSAKELILLAKRHSWQKVLLPKVGAGLGGLDWERVKLHLEAILDDRFCIVHYPE